MTEGVEPQKLLGEVRRLWDEQVLPTLESYVRIPNLSPHFAPDWAEAGFMDAAVELLVGWCRSRKIEGMEVEVVRPDGLTPSVVVEVPGSEDGAADGSGEGPGVLFYGHLDKQPEFTGWRDGLSAWEPVREGQKLYGRGVADDGYSVFAALISIEALRACGGSHGRCLVIIEGSEESGSPDLAPTLDVLKDRIGSPGLVVALDSGCPTYDRLWCTTSLRGLVAGTLTVRVLHEGVHSGSAGGIVPSSFRIARNLLSRLEDQETGEVLLEELRVPVPWSVMEDAKQVESMIGEAAVGPFPVVEGLRLLGTDVADRLLRHSWEPAMSVTGAEGLPTLIAAGNVLRPYTSLQLGFRLPPTCDSTEAAKAIERVLTTDPPDGAEVTFEIQGTADGWSSPRHKEWLTEALDQASKACYGKPVASVGEGGSIPFMSMLGDRMPGAQIVATGVLGPGSNAHGPNEFLELDTVVKLTAALSMILESQDRVRRSTR